MFPADPAVRRTRARMTQRPARNTSAVMSSWAVVVVLVVLLVVQHSSSFHRRGSFFFVGAEVEEEPQRAEEECRNVDDDGGGTCSSTSQETPPPPSKQDHDFTCGLYMAESSIPNAGWGLYTGVSRNANDNVLSENGDVIIQHLDHKRHFQFVRKHYNMSSLPKTLLTQYFWNGATTDGLYDADKATSISPGLGMMVNGHVHLHNIEQTGCRDRGSGHRNHSLAGASSSYQNCHFTTNTKKALLPAGHELFANYGDRWFNVREKAFGNDFPLSEDYVKANDIVSMWQKQVAVDGRQQKNNSDDVANDLWDTLVDMLRPSLSPRQKRALPQTSRQARQVAFGSTDEQEDETMAAKQGDVSYLHLPNAIRSLAWLQEHGLCVDQIEAKPITYRRDNHNHERGAFAKRPFQKGDMVAPAPMIHMSRKHVEMFLVDDDGEPSPYILWRGHQLLLNYCYGHAESSILLFPGGPVVNLINHPPRGIGMESNVALRWSERMPRPEWLQLSVDEVLAHDHESGLLMEFYALRDIERGEELLLDYGEAWQEALDRHTELWKRDNNRVSSVAVAHAEGYVSACSYTRQCQEGVANNGERDCLFRVPSWLETRCWIAEEVLDRDEKKSAGDDWIDWAPPSAEEEYEEGFYGGLDETIRCKVYNSGTAGETYRVYYQKKLRAKVEKGIRVKNVPLSAITFVDRAYTTNQALRSAFRHEIHLPDDIFPSAWRDLAPVPDSSCGLYMAESAIPNSGLGMFTAVSINKGEHIFYGDVVVEVEDIDLNMKLRRWMNKQFTGSEEDWLLHMYYWDPNTPIGFFDAEDIQSIIPGLGMLANSHTGLVNALTRPPATSDDLHRGFDPGTGASTTYYDTYFDAVVDIDAGSELFVQYGDEWFDDRSNLLGEIPLSNDFHVADKGVKLLARILGKDIGSNESMEQVLVDTLHLLSNVSSSRPKLSNAFPKDTKDFHHAVDKGTASLTVPDRIRSIEWLEENGQCLDNIRPDLSTIRQAGRGAFATRQIRKGQLIAPMPLVNIRRRHMEIYDSEDYRDRDSEVWSDGTQQLLNYCYGHPGSSLLFFPYAPVVNYVNHNITRQNAGLRWSDLPNHQTDWLSRTPDDLDSEEHAGLVMEMVATRDIEVGEEIFLNYGSDFESSWNNYVSDYHPTKEDMMYVSSAELNRRLERPRTMREEAKSSYQFEDILTVCFVFRLRQKVVKGGHEDEMPTHKWTGSENLFHNGDYAYPCDIIDRRSTTGLSEEQIYDVKDSVKPVDEKYTAIVEIDGGRTAKIEGIPRKAIRYFDAQYKSDNFYRRAFRHEIHLPEEMVPKAWRDLEGRESYRRTKR